MKRGSPQETSQDDSLFLIDSTSPFFRRHPDGQINWSKIPFFRLERKGIIRKKYRKKILRDFSRYAKRVAALGYNAISLDELCYMVALDFYNEELKQKIAKYVKYYSKLVSIASDRGLSVYVTTDIMFFNQDIEVCCSGNWDKIKLVFLQAVNTLFEMYPDIAGIITRIGESDGQDVKGEFRSRLVVDTPQKANSICKDLLSIMDTYDKHLVFRTWTLGSGPIGDLIWNPVKYRKLVKGITSPRFIISLKYGESDYFRFCGISKLFFVDNTKKIIELQTRREYEGFGEFPVYTGWEYEHYKKRLSNAKNIIGISVWCNTGGWSAFRNFTFLKYSSIWSEMNTAATIRIFKDNYSADEALYDFYPGKKKDKIKRFFTICDNLVNRVLYNQSFSRKKYYLFRLRLPPLLHAWWNNIILNSHNRYLYRKLGSTNPEVFKPVRKAYKRIQELKPLSKEIGLRYNYSYHKKTFRLFYHMQKVFHDIDSAQAYRKLQRIIPDYRDRFQDSYSFHINYDNRKPSLFFRILIRLVLRKKRGYRTLDQLLFNPVMRFLYRQTFNTIKKVMPDFMHGQAMEIETFLK